MTKTYEAPSMTPRMRITWNVLEAALDAGDERVVAACRRVINADRIGWRKHGNRTDMQIIRALDSRIISSYASMER